MNKDFNKQIRVYEKTINKLHDAVHDTYKNKSKNRLEWETACETWGTNPASVLTLIDRMRLTDEQNSPSVRSQELSKKREEATLNARKELKGLRLL